MIMKLLNKTKAHDFAVFKSKIRFEFWYLSFTYLAYYS